MMFDGINKRRDPITLLLRHDPVDDKLPAALTCVAAEEALFACIRRWATFTLADDAYFRQIFTAAPGAPGGLPSGTTGGQSPEPASFEM